MLFLAAHRAQCVCGDYLLEPEPDLYIYLIIMIMLWILYASPCSPGKACMR